MHHAADCILAVCCTTFVEFVFGSRLTPLPRSCSSAILPLLIPIQPALCLFNLAISADALQCFCTAGSGRSALSPTGAAAASVLMGRSGGSHAESAGAAEGGSAEGFHAKEDSDGESEGYDPEADEESDEESDKEADSEDSGEERARVVKGKAKEGAKKRVQRAEKGAAKEKKVVSNEKRARPAKKARKSAPAPENNSSGSDGEVFSNDSDVEKEGNPLLNATEEGGGRVC
jgi:hypothetical protein